jgi:nucleoside-diphosphate-sugar epimerase
VQSILEWNRLSISGAPISLTVYDNYVRGVPEWLMGKQKDPSLTLVHHDVTKPLPGNLPDYHYIIHAASIASPTYYRRYPIETMDANVNGLRFLLDYFRTLHQESKSAAGFLFFSSSEIYGDPPPGNIPTPESYRGYVSCTGPRACYDEAKRFGETLCVNFAQQFELPIVMVRPFNNYGPGLKISDRRALSDFACDVFSGRDIVCFQMGLSPDLLPCR